MSMLRLCHEDDLTEDVPLSPEPTVRMTVRELFPILMCAHRYNLSWLKDLADDEIVVTSDLADIVSRYSDIMASKRA